MGLKYTHLILFFVLIAHYGCKEHPSNAENSSVLYQSKTLEKEFRVHLDSTQNIDTSNIMLSAGEKDLFFFTKYKLSPISIESYHLQVGTSDTVMYANTGVSLNPTYTRIFWSTTNEHQNRGWSIERKDGSSNFKTIAFVAGAGTSNEAHNYMFEDNSSPSPLYEYRLKQVSFEGSYSYALQFIITLKATYSIDASLSVSAANGVTLSNADIAPETGYESTISVKPNDLIYFRNSTGYYGKLRIKSFALVSNYEFAIDEKFKDTKFRLSYEAFLQTNGSRVFK
ncbi:MAG: hypothetical protein HRU80_15815 [Ignavibacteriales bacterium]|nr:MAG: hypothetical protein HRU80_15815 [Ignavibacteriales bacterium]